MAVYGKHGFRGAKCAEALQNEAILPRGNDRARYVILF
jgi:hypothetical protein